MGILYLLIAACLWGTIGPISRLIFAAGITPLETAFWRGVLAGAAYCIHFVVMRGRILKVAPQDAQSNSMGLYLPNILRIIGFGLVGVALLEGSYVYAVHAGGAALASVLLYSAPIWVNLASWKFFGEDVSHKQWLALFTTSLGITGICLWGAPLSFSALAIVAGLLSGASYALFYLAGRVFFRSSHPVGVYMIAFPVASLALLPFIYAFDGLSPITVVERFLHAPHSAIFAMLTVGLLSTYLPYILHGLGLKRVDTGKAAILTTIEPIVSIALSHWMWGETFSAAGYAFAALVLIGVIFAR